MNEIRHKAILDSQSSIAKKVLSFVPIAESWPGTKIMGEMLRQTGATADKRIFDGCLMTLKDNGLVKEAPRGFFQAITPKPDPIPSKPKDAPMQIKPKHELPKLKKAEPLDRLAEVAAILRRAADEVEEAAMETSQRLESSGAKDARAAALAAALAAFTA